MNKDSMPAIAEEVVAAVTTATSEDIIAAQARASEPLGADPSYFDPEVPFTKPDEEGVVNILPPELAPVPVPVPEPHPQAAELAVNLKGLSAEEILAGIMPELSALYRARESYEANEVKLNEVITSLSRQVIDLREQLAVSNEEVNFAFRAGMEAEEQLAAVKCQKVLLESDLQVVATQRDSFLSDLRVGSDMLIRALVRANDYPDSASSNEYDTMLRSYSLIELVREVVGIITVPDYFGNRQKFFHRVAELRQAEAAQNKVEPAKGESNEQDSGTA